jgi:hypothetical protein
MLGNCTLQANPCNAFMMSDRIASIQLLAAYLETKNCTAVVASHAEFAGHNEEHGQFAGKSRAIPRIVLVPTSPYTNLHLHYIVSCYLSFKAYYSKTFFRETSSKRYSRGGRDS